MSTTIKTTNPPRGSREIDNSADIIDSRDIIDRIAWLDDGTEWTDDDSEKAELAALKALQDEAEGCSDWIHGACLIRDSHFQEYAQDLAEDIGAIDRNASWPACHIDWEAAADALKMDYTSVDFDGVEYWVRS